MNRRSILSSLSAGALALLAPVAAFAKPWRKARIVGTFGIKPMVITPREDLTPEQIAEFKRLWERDVQTRCVSWETSNPRGRLVWPGKPHVNVSREDWDALGDDLRGARLENASLRALLAEAGSHLNVWHSTFGTQDECDTERLIARIDSALK